MKGVGIQLEEMHPHFHKCILHFDGFHPAIHRFTAPDEGLPHDHPWNFTTHILRGGYIEDVYTVRLDGTWSVERIERKPGASHQVLAEAIHRIVALPSGECWTCVVAGPAWRQPRFWTFGDTVSSSQWDEVRA